MSKLVEPMGVYCSQKEYNSVKTLGVRQKAFSVLKSRRNKWLSLDWIYWHMDGVGQLHSLTQSIRDLRREKYGSWCIDSKVQEENGREVLYYRFRGKQKDNQTKLKIK